MHASNCNGSSINRSFSCEVMAAMLVYKNNKFSLLWELNSAQTFCTVLYTNRDGHLVTLVKTIYKSKNLFNISVVSS